MSAAKTLTRLDEIRERVDAAAEGPYKLWCWGAGDLMIRENVTAADAHCTEAEGRLLDNAPTDLAYLIAAIDQADIDRRHLWFDREQLQLKADREQQRADEAQAKLGTLTALLADPAGRNAAELHKKMREVIKGD